MPDGEDAHDVSNSFFAPLPWPPWLTASRQPPLAPPRAGFSFPQKQTLTYSVDWRVFPAGTAVLHFEAAGDRERITANADTIGAINLLFHVGDRFQSTFDRDKGCTYEFDKQTVEGRRQINSTLQAGLRPGQIHSGREEPGHRADQAPGGAHPRLPHRSADRRLSTPPRSPWRWGTTSSSRWWTPCAPCR